MATGSAVSASYDWIEATNYYLIFPLSGISDDLSVSPICPVCEVMIAPMVDGIHLAGRPGGSAGGAPFSVAAPAASAGRPPATAINSTAFHLYGSQYWTAPAHIVY